MKTLEELSKVQTRNKNELYHLDREQSDIEKRIAAIFKKKELYFIKFEFQSNGFTLTCFHSDKGWFLFNQENLDDLIIFLNDKSKILVGFKNAEYEDIILKLFYFNSDISSDVVESLMNDLKKKKTGQLIRTLRKNKTEQLIRSTTKKPLPWNASIDLYRVTNKKYSIQKWANSLKPEMTYISTESTENNSDLIQKYCKKSVLLIRDLFVKFLPEIEIRNTLRLKYGISHLMIKHDSKIGEEILIKEYELRSGKKLPLPSVHVVDNESFSISEIMSHKIKFVSLPLNTFLENIKKIHGTHQNVSSRLKQEITLTQFEFTFGAGGLHSLDKPRVIIPNESQMLIDLDVTSYYPMIMSNDRIIPIHLKTFFSTTLGDLAKQRIEAKNASDTDKAKALKIILNSVYGNLGNQFSSLYDPIARLNVVINGQLYLLMLLEQLILSDFEIVSANTDGVTCLISRERVDEFSRIANDWEVKLNFQLESLEYQKYVRRNINSYLALTNTDDIKLKGEFAGSISEAPIIAMALRSYFIKNESVESTVMKEQNMANFAYFFQASNGFTLEQENRLIHSTVRWYVSAKSARTLYKTRENERFKLPNGKKAKIINDLPSKRPEDLDFDHYIQKANKIINSII
jgi:hypothetical protein